MKLTKKPTHNRDKNGWLVASGFVVILLTVLLVATRAWPALGVHGINSERPPFSDTYALLMASDACRAGAGKWYGDVCFIPSIEAETKSQAYEPWLTVSRLGVTHEAYLPIAWSLIVFFYVSAALYFRPSSPRAALFFVLAMMSPAVQLGVERANFDLLIAGLLFLAGWLFSRRRTFLAVCGCAALLLTTALKLYTGLSLALVGLFTFGRGRTIAILAVLLLATWISLVGFDNIVLIGRGAAEGAVRFSTGAKWTFQSYGNLVGLAVVVLASFLAMALMRSAKIAELLQIMEEVPERWISGFGVSYLCAIPLFFLKSSYDYRLLLWLPMLGVPAALARTCGAPFWRRVGVSMLCLFFYVVSVELPCSYLDAWPGSGLATAATQILAFGKHVAIWALVEMSTIIAACAGLYVWRQGLREPF